MPTTPPPDHYATLGVSASASPATIRAAYRALISRVHPDVTGNDAVAAARALALNQAWTVLKDPSRRAAYDRTRASKADLPPVTVQHLRQAAAAERAYSITGAQQRRAFGAASLRVGMTIVVIGALVLALVILR
ncbi:MAG: J domain-containing protein [Euzebya sp.]